MSIPSHEVSEVATKRYDSEVREWSSVRFIALLASAILIPDKLSAECEEQAKKRG